jgi:LAGLIDADG endonuclease
MVPAAWRHVGTALRKEGAVRSVRPSKATQRNSLSGKDALAPPPREGWQQDRLISGKPSRLAAQGNPEGSPSDPVTTDPKGEAWRPAVRPQIYASRNTPALARTQRTYEGAVALDPWFVTGLTEGEGCFCVSFAIREKLRTGLEVRPSFALSLNQRDLDVLEDLQAFFGCGWIRESRADRTFKFESRSTRELHQRIVPHFESYPLRGSKARSFQGFAQVCQMIGQGDHLRRDGLREIIAIAFEMNLGKRRYSKANLLRVLSEVKG